VGRVFSVRGQEFTVRGIIAPAQSELFDIGTNINNAVYIPFGTAKSLLGVAPQINEITLKIDDIQNSQTITDAVTKTLLNNRGGQEDFTILRQEEYLSIANQVFTILTTFVAAIAGISLLVGGIGIMNIMLVSVSERTREIGVRKALGATNQQILSQFLVEATVISMLGGVVGVLLSLLAGFLIRISTSIQPSISVITIIVAVGVATIVGIIFGMAPAIQASRKDPIEALRHE
jgi:putative ABC transport system permease protein